MASSRSGRCEERKADETFITTSVYPLKDEEQLIVLVYRNIYIAVLISLYIYRRSSEYEKETSRELSAPLHFLIQFSSCF